MLTSFRENTTVTTPLQAFEDAAAGTSLLNELGKACIDRWVVLNAQDPAKQSLPDWYRYAETLVQQAVTAEEMVLEMSMTVTKSGYPEELRCLPSWFNASAAGR